MAADDGATLRVLSSDRRWLLGLAAYHRDRVVQAAMLHAMRATAELAFSGLWRQVIDTGRPAMWSIDRGHRPSEASPAQTAFIERFSVTRVMGAPVLQDDRMVGGVSLVRFGVNEDFSEADGAILYEIATQAARAVDLAGLADRLSRHYH